MSFDDRVGWSVGIAVAIFFVFRILEGHGGTFEIFTVAIVCVNGIYWSIHRLRLDLVVAKSSVIGMARLIMRVCNFKTCSEPPTAVESLTTTVVSTIVLSGLAIVVHIKQADPSWYGVLAVSALIINVVAWVVDWTAFPHRDDGS